MLPKEENWPQVSAFWQGVWDDNQLFFPGHEAWGLAVGDSEKGLGDPEGRSQTTRVLLARVDDCSCPAQTSSRNLSPFYFLGGSFFFFFQTVNRKKF